MTTIPVIWFSFRPEILARGYADQGFLEAALAGELWNLPGGFTFKNYGVLLDDQPQPQDWVSPWPAVDGGVFVFNGRTHVAYIDQINEVLNRYQWVVVLLCGDEEWDFPWRDLKHPNMRLWVMQARPEHAELGGRFIPGGWYPLTREHLNVAEPFADSRKYDWSFAGQITHERRQEFAEVARKLPKGKLYETDRYLAEAIPRHRYFDLMRVSKVIPSPSGPYSVDCARTFEALEAGCVPVADVKTAYAGEFDYWEMLFGPGVAFPRVSNWEAFPGLLNQQLEAWPSNANRVYSRWQQWKRDFVRRLHHDIAVVSGQALAYETTDSHVTAVVTTSPSPIHPSTEHIERTIDSVRAQLPDCEVVVVCDGVRPEQEHLRKNYEEYVRRLCWLTNFRWRNVVPLVLDSWRHQALATKAALELVHSTVMLFLEHDTPIVGDIQWERLVAGIVSGRANVIQLHINDRIIPEHQSIMLDSEPQRVMGAWLRRTSAWWQRPHLAKTDFYRHQILSRFTDESRTMIEDAIYPVMATQVADDPAWWDGWRVWVYEPDAPSILRSIHLDGRGDEPKYFESDMVP